jgi:hypothetical protein
MDEYKIQVNVKESDIEEFCLDFYDMSKQNIDFIRDGMYEIIEMAQDEPDLTEDPDFMHELSRAFAMRHALLKLNKLYDA